MCRPNPGGVEDPFVYFDKNGTFHALFHMLHPAHPYSSGGHAYSLDGTSHTHTRTHTHARARTHARVQTHALSISLPCISSTLLNHLSKNDNSGSRCIVLGTLLTCYSSNCTPFRNKARSGRGQALLTMGMCPSPMVQRKRTLMAIVLNSSLRKMESHPWRSQTQLAHSGVRRGWIKIKPLRCSVRWPRWNEGSVRIRIAFTLFFVDRTKPTPFPPAV